MSILLVYCLYEFLNQSSNLCIIVVNCYIHKYMHLYMHLYYAFILLLTALIAEYIYVQKLCIDRKIERKKEK